LERKRHRAELGVREEDAVFVRRATAVENLGRGVREQPCPQVNSRYGTPPLDLKMGARPH
jgi:hypothetical protein